MHKWVIFLVGVIISTGVYANGLYLATGHTGNLSGPTVPIASLTAHNTSAYSGYNQTNFPNNFGTASFVDNTDTIVADPTKTDLSLQAVSPGHVSNTDVHKLIPNRPDLKWFIHLMAGWWGSGQPVNAGTSNVITIGYTQDTDAYVTSMLQDIVNRGFNGVFAVWNCGGCPANCGTGGTCPADRVSLRIQRLIAANWAGRLTYAILIDEGLVDGQGGAQQITTLENAVNYLAQTYFTDSNYEKEGTNAFLPMYGVGDSMGDANMNTAYAAVGSTNTFKTSVWGQNSATHVGQTWSSFAFDWTNNFVNYNQGIVPNGYNAGDPCNTGAIGSFFTLIGSSKGMGAMTYGFNGTMTGSTTWSLGKYLPQMSAGCLVTRAAYVNSHITANTKRMQWPTWNDWAEGSAVENGIENGFTVTGSVAGHTLSWTFTSGTGDETTIDHYEIYASADGANAYDLGSVAPGTHSFNLGLISFSHGATYTLLVQAVGIACVRNHMSNSVSYSP